MLLNLILNTKITNLFLYVTEVKRLTAAPKKCRRRMRNRVKTLLKKSFVWFVFFYCTSADGTHAAFNCFWLRGAEYNLNPTRTLFFDALVNQFVVNYIFLRLVTSCTMLENETTLCIFFTPAFTVTWAKKGDKGDIFWQAIFRYAMQPGLCQKCK